MPRKALYMRMHMTGWPAKAKKQKAAICPFAIKTMCIRGSCQEHRGIMFYQTPLQKTKNEPNKKRTTQSKTAPTLERRSTRAGTGARSGRRRSAGGTAGNEARVGGAFPEARSRRPRRANDEPHAPVAATNRGSRSPREAARKKC